MEDQTNIETTDSKELAKQLYERAVYLIGEQNIKPEEVKEILIKEGADEESANVIVKDVHTKVLEAKRKGGSSDMLWGAIWCIGGIVATLADIGYIFYGAIIFGGIQFFKGLINSNR